MTSERKIVLIGVGLPIILVIGLLIWGTLRAGEDGGRPGVNNVLGEVAVSTNPYNDFLVETIDGDAIRLSDLRGNIVVIDFWSSWCPPCRAEARVLAEASDKWLDNGVRFVGISIWDDPKAVVNFIDEFKVNYPIAIDSDGSIAVDFGVKGIPEKFFVNPEGKIVRKIAGPNTSRSLDDVLALMSEEASGINAN